MVHLEGFTMYRIATVHPNAKIPERATEGSAGLDLCAAEEIVIPEGQWKAVETGIVLQFPPTVYGRVAPRSGLAFKYGIQVGAGVIDSDYTGSIKVILFNHGKEPFQVSVGDRIAQLIFERIETPMLKLVPFEALNNTARGAGGFGSTGRS
jgi:dUTP pyrophosphatase